MKGNLGALTLSFFIPACVWGQSTAALSKANGYYRAGQYDIAEKQYRAVLAKNDKNIIAQYNLANALYRQKKWKQAEEVLQKLGSLPLPKQTKAAVYYNQGVIYSRQKDLENSIEAYKWALRLTPSDTEARENLQKALVELKKQQQEKKSQPKPQPSRMSRKEAEQKLNALQQKEKSLQQRLQKKAQSGAAQAKDW